MDRLLSPFHQGKFLNTLFWANIFVSFHYALVIYINSSFLNNFFSETQISALYIIGSIVNTVFLLIASRMLEKLGGYRFAIYVIAIEFMTTVGMAVSTSPSIVAICFLTHIVAISLILFNMDVFVEDFITNESTTGGIRAAYLTLTNITIVLAPVVIAFILTDGNYFIVYSLSAISMIPLYFLMKRFKKVKVEKIFHIRIKETLSEYIKSSDLYNIFVSQFLLQLFYAFMVVYTPLYLSKYIGFSWTEIGIIFTIMLLPFVFLELPIGELADDKYGEKEFLTIGFIVMGLSTLFISFITVKIFWVWAVVLFITRIGASFVEISSESYFFKHVNREKTDVISFFRIARPISFIVAPVLATISLQFIPFQYIFIIIGTIMVIGTHYSLALHDTK